MLRGGPDQDMLTVGAPATVAAIRLILQPLLVCCCDGVY